LHHNIFKRMSKALIICRKTKKPEEVSLSTLKLMEKGILPDNIIPNNLLLKNNGAVTTCVFNPVNEKQLHNNSILLGTCSETNWWNVNDEFKIYDGSYAIFRENTQKI